MEAKRLYQLKGLPDCSAPMTSNSLLINTFEQPGNTVGIYQDIGMPTKPVHVLYCMAGHKISAGQLPLNSNPDRINLANTNKEVRFLFDNSTHSSFCITPPLVSISIHMSSYIPLFSLSLLISFFLLSCLYLSSLEIVKCCVSQDPTFMTDQTTK